MLNDLKTNDEEGRARALERLDILDTEDERPFDNIVSLVEQVLSVPMCAVSLVDRNRQWFKARRGLDDKETARDISFCTHTIQEAELFTIADARKDPRFADSPLVTGGPCIRSYAGVPLHMPDGYNIGALCAMDTKPREFLLPEIEMLKNFAKMVVSEIELRDIAASDLLTGALTRRAWMETADAELTRLHQQGTPLSLFILDIDKFKSVNDTYGHQAGDEVIVQLADTCCAALVEPELFGRYGGEEFVALLPETDLEGAIQIADRCRSAFADKRINLDAGKEIRCTASFGVTECRAGDTVEMALARADTALYTAKSNGRNQAVAAESEAGSRDAAAVA